MKKHSNRIMFCLLMAVLLLGLTSLTYAAPANKPGSALKKQINLVIKDCSITSKMTPEKKLKLLFTRIGNKKNYAYERAPFDFNPKTNGWANSYALSMLKNKRGSCYHHAAAFAYLARKATSLPVRICYGKAKIYSSSKSPHAWVEVKIDKKWYIYDTNAKAFAGKGTWGKLLRTSSTAKKLYFPEKTILLP
ncbi:MAG: transglutaminase domain-containing protein [Blautia sp.]|nr:transglutaminase domain-containing protein [Blautia sp.]